MKSSKSKQISNYRTLQALVLIYSFIFFCVITYGYFNLFIQNGWFLALIGGTVIAVFAWILARIIGSTPDGWKKHGLLLAVLFGISAAGVYNSLMLTFEGGQILSDTVTDSQDHFAKLQTSAEAGLATSGATAKIAKVHSLRDSLFSEIRNPLNCGQGPEAMRLISELQKELPGFTQLSGNNRDCTRNEEIVNDYNERIDALVSRASWNNKDLVDVASESEKARLALDQVRSEATTNYSVLGLGQMVNVFEGADAKYRNLLFRLSQHVDTQEIPKSLPILPVESLGNVAKLPALILSRIGNVSTWAYLIAAFLFDIVLIVAFQLVSANTIRRSGSNNALSGAM